MPLPLIPLISLITSGAGSLASGLLGSRAAGAAARDQIAAILQGIAATQTGAGQARSDLVHRLMEAINTIADHSSAARDQITGSVPAAIGEVSEGTAQANQTLQDILNQILESSNPWVAAGGDAVNRMQQSMDRLASLSAQAQEAGATPFSFQFSQDDPSYQFRVQEAQRALERSAAARGNLLSGQTGIDLTRLSQNLASTEYQNAFERALQTHQANAANRLAGLTLAGQQAGQAMAGAGTIAGLGADAVARNAQVQSTLGQAIAGNLMSRGAFAGNARIGAGNQLANLWQSQGAGIASLLNSLGQGEADVEMRTAQTIAQLLGSMGNASASGQIGSANAWGSALGGLSQLPLNWLILRSIMTPNPTPPSSTQP